MIRRVIVVASAVSVALAAAGAAGAAEQVSRTGSRLGTDTTQRMVYHLTPPAEVDRVRTLIEDGRTAEAVDYARDYLDSLRSEVSADGGSLSRKRYFALNALCVALTKDGRIDEAIETCTRAVELFPRHWVAINSRATAYYASRRFEQALIDYRRALEVAPDQEGIVETLEHNIELTEQRLAD